MNSCSLQTVPGACGAIRYLCKLSNDVLAIGTVGNAICLGTPQQGFDTVLVQVLFSSIFPLFIPFKSTATLRHDNSGYFRQC